VERRTLAALEAHLADPETIAARIREARDERDQAAREARGLRRVAEDRLREINTGLERIVDRIVDGTAPDALVARMHALETERKLLETRLGETEGTEPVLLHPVTAENYRQAASDLRKLFTAPRTEAVVVELGAQMRDLVDSIVIGRRDEKGPAPITVYGTLADMLAVSGATPHWSGDLGRGERI
jgi:hypothetical protein